MKIRNGFVSNSSSTSFTFIFKGSTVDDLCDVLLKYSTHFDLVFENYDDVEHVCNVNDVITALKSVVKNASEKTEDDYDHAFIMSLDEKNDELEKELNSWRERLEESIKEDDNYDTSWIHNYMMEIYEKQRSIKQAIKRNLNCVIEVGFGDNHGQIEGTGLGTVMDYEGRYIRINQKNLIVYTDQNR